MDSSQASTSTSPVLAYTPAPIPHASTPRSILKRPPPTQRSFFSLGTLSRFIPASPPNSPVPVSSFASSLTASTPEPASARPLRRAHFILPHLTTVYPISSAAAPSSAELTIARKEIDESARVARAKEKQQGAAAWSLGRVEEFYRECARLREETALGGVIGALRQANLIAPRTLDLTSVKLNVDSAHALADALAVEWGLRKLILRDCDLDDFSLKPILHALLIPASLSSLAIPSNRRLKQGAYKLVGAYISQSETVEFLDLSQVPLDKRSIEHIISAVQPAPPALPGCFPTRIMGHTGSPTSPMYALGSSYFPPLRSETLASPAGTSPPDQVPLLSVRLDECALRGGALDLLAHAIRPSAIQNISLRGNKVGPPGAVALALMIKDYPDSVPSLSTPASAPAHNVTFSSQGELKNQSDFLVESRLRSPSLANISSATSSVLRAPLPQLHAQPGAGSTASSIHSLPSPPATPPPSSSISTGTAQLSEVSASSPSRHPPPRHPRAALSLSLPSTSHPLPDTNTGSPVLTTTYTPYIPKSRRKIVPLVPNSPLSGPGATSNGNASATGVPVFTSLRAGGITAMRQSSTSSSSSSLMVDGHSATLLDNIRSLDSLPRLGSLQVLDLRGNDLRGGVQYIAQVLKRNRTLKVLSLADNRIDVTSFLYVADALKYNSTLETLDMSHNPCCGPTLEGVIAIRTAITINTALARLNLANTGLTSAGAIALAEFLPDARSLLHLDLTQNESLDIAGVMALSVGLKVNGVLRCLDVDVPPNNAPMARLSREILRSCVRNTERADVPGDGDAGNGIPPTGRGTSSVSMEEDLAALFGGSARGGVWGLIERSELARGVKQDVERERVGLERAAATHPDGRTKLEIWRKTPDEVLRFARELLLQAHGAPEVVESEALLERASALLGVVSEMVQIEKDPSQLEELLELSDRLNGLLKDLKTGHAPYGPERPGVVRRNSLKGKEKATEYTDLAPNSSFSIGGEEDENPIPVESTDEPETTQRSEQEVPEVAATVLNRTWVEEEGEIFRKGNVLLGPTELGEEGADINSDELKRELLEAQVERRPRHDNEEDSSNAVS